MGLAVSFYSSAPKNYCFAAADTLAEMHYHGALVGQVGLVTLLIPEKTSEKTREILMSGGFLLSKVTADGVREVWYRQGILDASSHGLHALQVFASSALEEQTGGKVWAVHVHRSRGGNNRHFRYSIVTDEESALVTDTKQLRRIYGKVSAEYSAVFPSSTHSWSR